MALKGFVAKVGRWRFGRGGSNVACYEPLSDDSVSQDVVLRKGPALNKKQSSELITEGFSRLIEQLEGINGNLESQANRHDALMEKINNLPEVLNALPQAAESQMQVAQALAEQLKEKALKEQQFIEAIEKIPNETVKQTNTLVDMSRKLSIAADIDAQMGASFNKFNDAVSKLSANTVDQSDSIGQMNKTFAASDRYLKYLITKQNRRMMWMFITTVGVCAFAVVVAVLCIVTILQK